ncbi:hypothetical protein E1B28_000500 [Marasmius oreades]|uniref:Uncharacterized protein n=1 Tax=Marasmius oreades TaxID=181124 RepID=A0A9P7V1L4_9AGAR|nr:uncharacterized protein E1B28_000500 [Marasmius oreades]KAG7098567.1 hypothetical protein E1B28_000500 [Marasmius oreades]
METKQKEYVKGYGVDWEKVKATLEVTDDHDCDGRIDEAMACNGADFGICRSRGKLALDGKAQHR